MIEAADLDRLAREGFHLPSGPAWVESIGMSEDCCRKLINSYRIAFAEGIEGGESPDVMIAAVAGEAFRLGWEAHKQYGRRA